MTSRRERLEASIAGEVADRPPVALWRHFPVDDQDPLALAASHVQFQHEHDFDFLKISPASSFCLQEWGARDVWEGDPEGTRRYTHRVVSAPEDWGRLPVLSPEEGSLAGQLVCLERLRRELGPDVPLVQTVFSPLAQAKNLAGDRSLLHHLRAYPERVERGLETIARSVIAFVEAVFQRGADGIFYAVQHASYHLFDQATYARFGERYDRRILDASGAGWCNVLHLHGDALMFDLAERYPVQVVNWHDRGAGPDLSSARGRVRGAVCGGLSMRETMLLGDPAKVRAEALEALQSVACRGVVLGAGCVAPALTPRVNLHAAREAVEECA